MAPGGVWLEAIFGPIRLNDTEGFQSEVMIQGIASNHVEAGQLPFNDSSMLQILQSLKTGETMLAEVSAPMVLRGDLLIATHASLVSAVTERILVEFGKSGWLQKARNQPDKVKAVIEKIKVDGLRPTLQAVKPKLDQPIAHGLSQRGFHIRSGSRCFVR